MTSSVDGHTAAGFEDLRHAFAAAFEGKPRMGAALAVRQHGEVVVDLWGGAADHRAGRPWRQDTTSVVFSCTKGLMSILAARLVQDGRLDYDAPVAAYWPEFAQAGKSGVLVRHVLAHRAGLSAPRRAFTRADLTDWATMTTALAEQEPLWEPGTGHAYHALTHGWLVGEIIRRVTGRSPGQFLAETVTAPLCADTWLGLPPQERDRVAHLHVGPSLTRLVAERARDRAPGVPDWPHLGLTLGGAFPPDLADGFNDHRVQAAENPGAGVVATARALATIWSATVTTTDGVRLLDDATVTRAVEVQTDDPPVLDVLPPWPRWGMGFQLDSSARRYLTPAGFGHDGAGGQVSFADPTTGIGFAFLTNQLEAGEDDDRATHIVDTLRRVVSHDHPGSRV
ncbi:serine hydrolase domain-containing protein [Jiangella alkaliphila]|uniref:CubicO group peptidase, beta-lactamase class C family n=1 Tax=Jiangella alkaliphila TaxID=419479 RepID=A0A1H2LBL1_9ACTN|nr:serine hydrolase domain-containing protein [Jiangella alkaliphila]SDU78194.1 CubicO group peptidase, beta-lactamase class C family [Jiangella alkaliphila]